MKRFRLLMGLALVLGAVPSWSCDDPEWECRDACEDLAECENEWLVADGEEPMNNSEFDMYVDNCAADCEQAGTPEGDIRCILDATCDELQDGECRN